jgi:putative phage-type endonuclease
LDERDQLDARLEFIESQQTGIGATDVPKVLGLSRWGTARTVYRSKIEPAEPDEMSLPAWMGLKLQNTVGELYTAATGIRLRADHKHHRHRKHRWAVAHLDFRRWGDPGWLVEAKTKAYMAGWGEDGTQRIPPDVYAQVQWEMFVSGARECHVAVLFGHHTFRAYPIPRDEVFIDALVPRMEAFWHENVLARVPPPPTGHALDAEDIRDHNPDHDERVLTATPEQARLVKSLKQARINKAQAELAATELENRIKELIGTAAGLTSLYGTVTWKRTKDSQKVAWELLAGDYRAVLEKLLEVGGEVTDYTLGILGNGFGTESLDDIRKLRTTTEPGYRRINVSFTEEDT